MLMCPTFIFLKIIIIIIKILNISQSKNHCDRWHALKRALAINSPWHTALPLWTRKRI